jgi:hypothetical protein
MTALRGSQHLRWEKKMHLSKRVLYFGIIAYSIALLVFQDWGSMAATVGTVSALWLGKMLLDVGFAGLGAVRLAGPAFFADDEDDDEDVTIHAEDMAVSDTMLFGVFLANIVANLGFHAYATVTATGAESIYYSVWVIAEAVAFLFAALLFKNARAAQRKLARKTRDAAKAAGSSPISGRGSDRGVA